jgi:hypothetical protein
MNEFGCISKLMQVMFRFSTRLFLHTFSEMQKVRNRVASALGFSRTKKHPGSICILLDDIKFKQKLN